ncbi:DUF305 domain-containing protein [Microbacterium hominis]|uniref:DUF305 domain-containing protein n=1 Tax=Microbacterium hominis TaxID=162426 RepID=A0A7D4QA29_9MICO|nr:DUF305 domain-containing protein [Microbacterium hominis]QKJ20939.1 DUF305 domain-containing protein [Microbacterium hominis]
MNTRTLAATSAALLLTAALAITGCAAQTGAGGTMPATMHEGGASASPPATGFNGADAMFTAMMIPHHEQALEMSAVLLGKDGISAQARELAQQIEAAQGPEIAQMEDWLEEWGLPMTGGSEDMHHGDGMMSGADMEALEAATGAEAERLFLEQMIEHHEGAIDMAEREVERGIHPGVIALAEDVITGQTAEIQTMREMLAE